MLILKILKEYIRRIGRNYKIYAVSILGMSIAIIASFHIYHFVYKELSVDSFHTKRKDIYRLANLRPNSSHRDITTPLHLGKLLKEKLPDVVSYTRVRPVEGMVVKIDDETSFKNDVSYIDASLFKIFNFGLKQGSVQEFNDTPNGIVISEKIANTIFKGVNPIGKSISISEDYKAQDVQLNIIGIMNNIPQESSIQGDYFINMATLEKSISKEMSWAITTGCNLYVHAPNLKDKNSFTDIASNLLFEKFKFAVKSAFGETVESNFFNLKLQRFDKIYFHSSDILEQKNKGNLQFLIIVILVGILTLFLATSNYVIMNLGLNMNRAKEFKTRRYLGASRGSIFTQLNIESFLKASICFTLALLTYPIIGTYIGKIIGFDYQLSLTNDFILLITYFGIVLTIGFITGSLEFLLSYKTIFLSKKNKGTAIVNSWFSKKVMITFQFFLFLSLIISILFLSKQINFIQNKDLGFDAENVANIPTRNHKELKDILDAKSYVKTTSYSYNLFRDISETNPLIDIKSSQEIEASFVHGDYNFLKVYDIELLYGENFHSKEINTQKPKGIANAGKELSEVLVNEEFVKNANLKNPIGNIFKNKGGNEFIIKGVFKNVYNMPLYFPMQPLVILNRNYDGWYYGSLAVSFDKGNKQQLESDLRDFFISKGTNSLLLDDIIWNYNYKDIYKKELQLKRLLEAFTVIVLLISILGMIAISLFVTKSKTKEIGIRKVNGATIKQIMVLLNKNFIKWVAIAFIIACPIAYYAMGKWLENFAYKTSLSWWVFALAGVFTLTITLFTVSWQSYKAAMANPAKSLRTE